MTPPFDFNLWDNLDEDSVRLTQTSEFWIQVQSEAETFDLVPPNNMYDALQDDEDWSILPPEEAHKDTKVLHDCMWAGSCTDLPILNNTFVPSDLISATPGQSLLRRDMSPSRPDTPPSLDGDEPPQFRHAVDVASTARRLLRDTAVAVAADHSYTLARQQPVSDWLGVQTPSDSCESGMYSFEIFIYIYFCKVLLSSVLNSCENSWCHQNFREYFNTKKLICNVCKVVLGI